MSVEALTHMSQLRGSIRESVANKVTLLYNLEAPPESKARAAALIHKRNFLYPGDIDVSALIFVLTLFTKTCYRRV